MTEELKTLIGRLLDPTWEDNSNAELLDSIRIDFPNSWYKGEFYFGKYLAWDEDRHQYYLADEEQGEY